MFLDKMTTETKSQIRTKSRVGTFLLLNYIDVVYLLGRSMMGKK